MKHTHVHVHALLLYEHYIYIVHVIAALCSYTMYSHTSADEVPSDHVLWQFAQPVAQQTKNWARLVLYLGLLPADAASTQHYQVYMQFTYMYGDVHTVYMYMYTRVSFVGGSFLGVF